jgi:hypothetical protein
MGLSKSNSVEIDAGKRTFTKDTVYTQKARPNSAGINESTLGRGQRDKRPQIWMKDYVN